MALEDELEKAKTVIGEAEILTGEAARGKAPLASPSRQQVKLKVNQQTPARGTARLAFPSLFC